MQRGHHVQVVVPTTHPQRSVHQETYDDVPICRFPCDTSPIPFVKNYYRHERLWQPLATFLATLVQNRPSIIHAQHVRVMPAAIIAGQRCGVPVVVTVRDHWPWDYFATGLHGNTIPYDAQSPNTPAWAPLVTDLPARLGAWKGVWAYLALPYIFAHMQRRAAFLAQADAVIAVSSYIAQRLQHIVASERIVTIPNSVDIATNQQIAATPLETPIREPFLLFVGKLERNKGAQLLGEIVQHLINLDGCARETIPLLVIVGSGTLHNELAHKFAHLGIRTRFLSWTSHDEVLRLLLRCQVLLFPSSWGEPLSRVLLEASSLGTPILAMPTGGTPDIITNEYNGILAPTTAQFAHQLMRLLQHPNLCQELGHHARQRAIERFSINTVIPQVENLYRKLLHE